MSANRNWPLMHLDVKSTFLNGPLQEEVYVSQPHGGELMYLDKGIILHKLKYELELLEIFELTNCKSAIIPAETNHKLDSDVEGDDVDATTFKQLVGSLRYLYNTIFDIYYAVGMSWYVIQTLISVETELTKEVLLDISLSIWEDLKIKASKSVKLMIDKKLVISLAKNPVLHERSKDIDTEFHFPRH
ncbi:uncharacterized protein LOC127123506 [Lathyrus oleraceus]|uniref:uncharacterized protein LOC127123506 n=1 Tax=Pisum sativum TaxID=3888 RepID=UPI0021D0B9C3|nr:uncharacterized protein LOC127123506 [Pisum sativum]